MAIILTASSAGALISFSLGARQIQNSGMVARVFLFEPHKLSDRVKTLRRWTIGCFAVQVMAGFASAIIG